MKTGPSRKPILDRFLSFISEDEAGCWIWTGGTNGKYGVFRTGYKSEGTRKSSYAHRVSYELLRGPIADGMFVCHTCDVPLCVNPNHFFLGTNSENILDAVAKGTKVGSPGRNSGAANGRAVLSPEEVLQIRSRREGGERVVVLAREYGVTKTHIHDIVTRKSWKHL